MSSQIKFFDKNRIDLQYSDIQITVTDATAYNNGQDFVNRMRDRKNYTAWMTTDSNDAALTQLDINLGDQKAITDIIIVGHNLKNYTIQYRSGIAPFDDFPTAIAPTNDTGSTSAYNFTQVQATDIRIIINGTQVADADKVIKQLIITKSLGQFEGWPQIKKPKIDTNKKITKMLSGKSRIVEGLESFSCTLDVKAWRIQEDLDLVEQIYFKREGVLMWINANDPAQFFLDLKGYRQSDIFLVRPSDDYGMEFLSGVYVNAVKTSMSLVEVIT